MLFQIVLLFFNSFSWPIQKGINLLFLSLTLIIKTHQLILGNIKTNRLRTLSNYPIKYLEIVFELVFLSVNFEITILSILASQIFIYLYIIYFFAASIFFPYLSLTKSQYHYTIIDSITELPKMKLIKTRLHIAILKSWF